MNGLGWFYLLGLMVTLPLWWRLIRRDRGLAVLYFVALFGALIGSKVGYLAAEGWMVVRAPDAWMQWLSGKTIVGALIGGFVFVEIGKALLGERRVTGDFFAVVAPLGIAVGRVGCRVNGCCPGRDGWPAAEVELAFNLLAALAVVALRRTGRWPGQLFHGYLIAYGLFRFGHEFLRETPACCLGVTGYQVMAVILVVIGTLGWKRRMLEQADASESL